MKKIIAFILVLTFVLSMGSIAFAGEVDVEPAGRGGGGGSKYEDQSYVKINKSITVPKGVKKPAETFQFMVGDGVGERDGNAIVAPAFPNSEFEISIAANKTSGSKNIELPNFTQVGVYTYPITEIAGNTAGMNYDNIPKQLKITVINNPNYGKWDKRKFLRVVTMTAGTTKKPIKVETFKNSFEAGKLTIKKVITGNYADPNDEFTVTVRLTPKDGKVIKVEPIDWGKNITPVYDEEDNSYTATYTLKGGDDFTIKNIPYDVEYKVDETDSGKYKKSYDNNRSGEIKQTSIKTTITNNRNIKIDTGINLNSLPYLIILVAAIGGLAIFIVRRRMAISE